MLPGVSWNVMAVWTWPYLLHLYHGRAGHKGGWEPEIYLCPSNSSAALLGSVFPISVPGCRSCTLAGLEEMSMWVQALKLWKQKSSSCLYPAKAFQKDGPSPLLWSREELALFEKVVDEPTLGAWSWGCWIQNLSAKQWHGQNRYAFPSGSPITMCSRQESWPRGHDSEKSHPVPRCLQHLGEWAYSRAGSSDRSWGWAGPAGVKAGKLAVLIPGYANEWVNQGSTGEITVMV